MARTWVQEHSHKFKNIQGYINKIVQVEHSRTLGDPYEPWILDSK